MLNSNDHEQNRTVGWSGVASKVLLLLVLLSAIAIGCANDNLPTPVGELSTDSISPTSVMVAPLLSGVQTAERADGPNPRTYSDLGASYSGTLRMVAGNLVIPDPAQYGATPTTSLVHHEIYAGLVRNVVDNRKTFELDMAQRYEVDGTGKVYDFVLKPDLKFSDGSPVTASDFKWSWERALWPETGSEHAESVLGSIVGADEILKGTTKELTGVTVVDDQTIRIVLDSARADFPYLLANPVASVLKRENVEVWGMDWSKWAGGMVVTPPTEFPLGTGPFKLENFELANTTVLVRNQHYHEYTEGIERVEFVTAKYAPNRDIMGAFMAGDIDIAYVSAGKFSEWTATGNPLGDFVHYFDSVPGTVVLAFNDGREPYDDLDFRLNLVAGADAPTVANELGFEPVGSLMPEGIGRKKEFQTYNEGMRTRVGDRLTAQLAHLNLTQLLTLHTWIDGAYAREFSSIGDNWSANLGLSYEYSPIGTDRYFDMLNRGEIEMVMQTIKPDYPDPHATLGDLVERMFVSQEQSSPGWNEIRHMLEDAVTESDATLRIESYQLIDTRILEKALAMPIYEIANNHYVLVQPWVRDFRIPEYPASMFKNVRFEDTHKW